MTRSTSPRLASDLTLLQRRRLGWLVARGASVSQAARQAGLGAPAAEQLVTDEKFAALANGYRAMASLPEDERHRRLVAIAMRVLEEAIVRGSVPACLFILKHKSQGREPAEVLARGVIRSLEREPASQKPAVAPPVPKGPSCPVDNATGRAGAMLRAEVMDEVEIEAEVQAARRRQQPKRPPVAIGKLSPRQVALLQTLTERRRAPTGTPPETDPKNPNAP